MTVNQIEGGVIIFHFRDGPLQGDTVRSDVATDRDSTNAATTFWAMTQGGKIGRTLKTTGGGTIGDLLAGGVPLDGKQSGTAKHLYRVVDRTDSPKQIEIFVEFVKSLAKE
ncbi:hypothetical protein EC9_51050 [Rosistilla ulvae]|uniref:Uncharacterized protein n=1 Tax=Rosistilla ulvae TaxID=1930277 RepID=A0A517M7W7_9BACT|nr:hypothetical protein [Rosistilla ulvae]QDS90887.1 hypothetical protein EC9_51050 [Rosistilla ulvae]